MNFSRISAQSLAALSLAALSSPVFAQNPTATIPGGYLATEGSSQHHPGWYYTNGRSVYVINSGSSGMKGTTLIRGLRTRGNGTATTGVAWSGDFEVRISSRGVSTTPDRTSFGANHGTDLKVFMKRKRMNVAGWTARATPRAWGLDFRGDAPFITTADTIAIDVAAWTTATATHNNYQDAQTYSTSGDRGTVSYTGTGCPTNFFSYSTGHYWGNVRVGGWYTYGYSRKPGDVHFAVVGARKLPTPVQIGTFGTAPCNLYVIPLFVSPAKVTTTTDGYSYFTMLDYAALQNKSFIGTQLALQHAAIDATTKTIKTSRMAEVRVGAGLQQGIGGFSVYNYASGSTTFDPDKDAPRFNANTVVVFGRY